MTRSCIPLNVKDFLYVSVVALGKKSVYPPPPGFTVDRLNSSMNTTRGLSVYTPMDQLQP